MAPGSCCCVARVKSGIDIYHSILHTRSIEWYQDFFVVESICCCQAAQENHFIPKFCSQQSYHECITSCLRLSQAVQLLFLVMSTPDDKGIRRRALARKAIYKDYSNQRITVKFVMGTKYITEALIKQLESEQREFQDLVLLADHVDTYYKLPSKVISSIQWAVENEQFDYLVKTDHDVIVFFDNIKKFIKRLILVVPKIFIVVTVTAIKMLNIQANGTN